MGLASKLISKGTARVAKAARKQKPKKSTQTTGEMSAAERAIERELASDKVAKGSRSENITVGSKSEVGGVVAESATKGSRAIARRKAELQRKVDDGTATAAEKKELKALRLKDQLDLSRAQQTAGQTRKARKPAEPDKFMIALKAANKDGELVDEFFELSKRDQDRIISSAKRRLEEGDPDAINKMLLAKRNPPDKDVKAGKVILGTKGKDKLAKGGQVTKSRIGPHDYRMNKGGLLLSSVDNRKKK